MEPVCEVRSINKTYNKQKILNECSLSINKGEIYGLIGRNGVGKTTLMKVLMGLVRIDSGKIEILGVTDPKKLIEKRKKMSAIIENPAFYPYMTAFENLKIHQNLLFGKTDKEKINYGLEKVGLLQDCNKKVKNYSVGMKQRLGIARALSSNAEIVILDEPTNGLDLEGMRMLRELILTLNKEHGVTFLISSHHIAELEQIATVFGILNRGKIVLERNKEQLFEEVKLEQISLEDFMWKWMK